ncbi:flagellum biosynthesis repressor protein FlbT [Methylobacterium crusticola]|uniref:Flagellum biosynthesis repressor protein FlbT n=1 Tax=Methylobacterium crusticola TaxID=1697972 RepID=A0ABQ4R591_9HYPH|nr:flagellum biosynthesis repressor protein FlbT [Methylobacterium crusticola]
MRLSLRAGERVYINGAVLRVDRRVAVELLNDATFLLEGHVLQAAQATTPLRQLYFAAQTMLIEPGRAGPARALYDGIEAGILAATREGVLRDGLAAARGLVGAGRPFEALKLIRGLYPLEAALMASAQAAPDPAAPPQGAASPAPDAPPAGAPLARAPAAGAKAAAPGRRARPHPSTGPRRPDLPRDPKA